MILYHGSNIDIETISLNASNVGKDFGCGFYLTPDLEVAQRQAKRRADIDGGEPIVMCYEFCEADIKKLQIAKFDNYSIEWAEFVKANRANRTRQQVHNFDIVIGPIADDDIGMQMRKFNAGRITIEQFMDALKWKKVTIQYFFGTEQALKTLKKL